MERARCAQELQHVPIEAQLLAGHRIRGGYELAVDCAPNGGDAVPPCVHEAFFHLPVGFERSAALPQLDRAAGAELLRLRPLLLAAVLRRGFLHAAPPDSE